MLCYCGVMCAQRTEWCSTTARAKNVKMITCCCFSVLGGTFLANENFVSRLDKVLVTLMKVVRSTFFFEHLIILNRIMVSTLMNVILIIKM